MQLHRVVENNHERAYCNMINDAEMQDAKAEWIESRAKELIENFGNDNDWQIIELLKTKLESTNIDANIYNQFVTDICYSQANFEFNKKFQHSGLRLPKTAHFFMFCPPLYEGVFYEF